MLCLFSCSSVASFAVGVVASPENSEAIKNAYSVCERITQDITIN